MVASDRYDLIRAARLMLKSVRRACPDAFIRILCNLEKGDADLIQSADLEAGLIQDASMTPDNSVVRKLEHLPKLLLGDGDRLLVVDADVLFKQSPFDAFDRFPSMDLGLTTRYYDYEYPVNGGVWMYREAGKGIREWMASQMAKPSWPPYVKYRREHGRGSGGWWRDQDLLCCLYDNRWREDVDVMCLTAEYNWCPSERSPAVEARQLMDAVVDPDVRVLHFKGVFKGLMETSWQILSHSS